MKKQTVTLVRDGEIKLTLQAIIRADGTLWSAQGMPILGIDDPAEKRRMVELVKAKKFSEIPAEYYVRLGHNSNGIWAGSLEEWRKTPEYRESLKKEAEKEERRARRVTVYLSARGWGDFSPLEWYGDITRPEADILAECRRALAEGHDVDMPNQSDEELLGKIRAAREAYETAPARRAASEAAETADIQRKIATGYCFNCGTYCHGDCGNYSNDPAVEFRRGLSQAMREAACGVND